MPQSNEPVFADGKPCGYYLLCRSDVLNDCCLVYLYRPQEPEFNNERCIAYGAQDGACVQPVSDLCDNCFLIPAVITTGGEPTPTTQLGAIAGQWIEKNKSLEGLREGVARCLGKTTKELDMGDEELRLWNFFFEKMNQKSLNHQ